ncbi:thioredoxin-like protein [Colletotrichum navitas]|uniref:Thioredoxin-like protein n=1 Tax=Colletotrichum navitas TaxID=681940 RepID=A0AAD8PYX8_9PEZI|nr:thioredoxin-like protein [Colletotrichum navitas]KAK1590668.1 thioredoxin-like protein [Colletotrichum navitas]
MSGKYAFTKALKEVRFLFCQTGEHSAATRSFVARAYPTMKKNNPQTPILLREAAGTLPKVYARYGQDALPHPPRRRNPRATEWMRKKMLTEISLQTEFGVEKSQSLEGLSDKQIEDTVTTLVKNGA